MNSSTRRAVERLAMRQSPECWLMRRLYRLTGGEAKRYESLRIEILQYVARGPKRRAQRQRRRRLKSGIGVVAFLEPVIRDPRVDMMHVVKANIAGKPLEQARQAKIGGACEIHPQQTRRQRSGRWRRVIRPQTVPFVQTISSPSRVISMSRVSMS